jgi:hypothetical protein
MNDFLLPLLVGYKMKFEDSAFSQDLCSGSYSPVSFSLCELAVKASGLGNPASLILHLPSGLAHPHIVPGVIYIYVSKERFIPAALTRNRGQKAPSIRDPAIRGLNIHSSPLLLDTHIHTLER